MSTEFNRKAKHCCSIEHDRLVAELAECDKQADHPQRWHRCARALSRRSSARAKECMLRK